MHGAGIMHNDVKVENILLTKDGTAKLCDFGSCSREKIDLSGLHKSQMYKH
jgi:serine/threonine protein kinase